MSDIKYATDYSLRSIRLVSPGVDVALELKPHLVELNFFEDLYNNSISGKLVISEALGLLSRVGINGTEFIKISFSKINDESDTIDRTFRIYSITDRVYDIAKLFESYTINFCSEEFLVAQQYRISKSFQNKKISEIVSSILSDYLKVGGKNRKQGGIEETTGLYDFILPNKKVFETINWLAMYALPATQNPGADMLFFENNAGYHFRSLQSLFVQKTFATYFFNPKNVSISNGKKDLNQEIFNVMKLEILDSFDTLGAVEFGSFSNRVISLDILTRKKTVTDFNYNEYLPNSKSLNGKPVTNNYTDRHKKAIFEEPPKDLEAGSLRMAVSNSDHQNNSWVKNRPGSVSHDISVEKYLPNRVAQLSLANYNRIRVTIPGNTQVTVGVVIQFNTVRIQEISSNSEKTLDPQLSGRYLVTAVRHIITNIAYITVLELAKESTTERYTNVNMSDSSWNALVEGDQR